MTSLELRARAADLVWRLGTPVVEADLSSRTVRLDDGTDVNYDGLVVATRLRSRRLPLPGAARRYAA